MPLLGSTVGFPIAASTFSASVMSVAPTSVGKSDVFLGTLENV